MKRLFLILFSLLLYVLNASVTDKVYKVAILEDWKPYYFIDSNGKPNGYAIELFEKIAKSKNLKYEYIILDDFKDILRYLEEGRVDIIPNIGVTKSREELFSFTNTTDTFLISIYKRLESTKLQGIKDLKDKKIGVVSTNVCNKLITDKISTKKIEFNHFWQLISSLKTKEIDAFCYPTELVEHLITDSDIVPLKMAIKELNRAIGVSKNSSELIPILNEAISELKLSGKYKDIYYKWFKKGSFIELTKQETLFLTITILGVSFTLILIFFYIISKKKWLVTKNMLQEEIKSKTNTLRIQNKRLKKIHKKLKEQTYKDVLTKIYNRKFFNEKIEELLSLHRRYKYTFSFIIFDIDDFKIVNDTYGHIVGDKVLIELTKLINEDIRVNDYFFRVGGEEFILLLSETNLDEAKGVALKIKDIVEYELKVIKNKKITISIGLTEVVDSDDTESIYKRADDYLYKAKKIGKNTIVYKGLSCKSLDFKI